MLLAALAAWWMTPREGAVHANPGLAQVVPAQFGEWKELKDGSVPVDPTSELAGERTMKSPYDDVLMRTYSNSKGDVIQLALAYGRHQRQEIKIHRPELCYISQGFGLINQYPVRFPALQTGTPPIMGMRMLVGGPRRTEAVSYWIRIGGIYSGSAWLTRAYIFKQGLQGHVVDGVLMRVSQVVSDAQSASTARYEVQERFASDLIRAIPDSARRLLTGSDVI
jgi:EpsI family protein